MAEVSERVVFRPAMVIGLITAGLISFAAFIALLGWGEPEEESGGPGTGAVPTASAVGFRGIMSLASRFMPARAVANDADFHSYDLLVVPLRTGDSAQDVADLLARRPHQPTLLILPKWSVTRDPQQPRWVRAYGPLPPYAVTGLLGPGLDVGRMTSHTRVVRAQSYGIAEGIEPPLPSAPQVLLGARARTLIGVPGEGALVAQLGSRPHYVVADPDLLNNHGLRSPETAAAGLDLLDALRPHEGSAVLFATSVTGPEAPAGRNLIRAMFEPPFLAMTIALIVAALLAGLHGAFRFGPARRPARAIPFGKAALVENSAGLVRLAGREVRLGGGYADLVRDDAARTGGAPPHLQGEALEAYLDRFTRPGERPFRQLAWELRAAQNKGELIAAARALFRWKKDMIR
jgi:hypothetical protein